MKFRLIIRRQAESELDDAKTWYDKQRKGIGSDFLICIEDALEKIGRNPALYPVVHKDIRRVLVRRFPYGIFYRVVGEVIVVLAVFHSRRNPRDWQSRT